MPELVPVVKKGDLRASLEALRDKLAAAIDVAKPGEVAALSRQLSDVLGRIAAMPGEEKSKLDDLTARRAARKATVQKRSASQLKSGKGRG